MDDLIVQGTIFFPLDPTDSALDEALRRAVAAIGSFSGEEFAPEGKRAAAFLRGEISARRVALIHPLYSEATGYTDSRLYVSVGRYPELRLCLVSLGIHMGHPGEQDDIEWKMGLEIMPRLVDELAPTLAFMSASLVDHENRAQPPEKPLPGSALPPKFTAWTYMDGERLDQETRDKLAALPATSSAPLGRGWLVQAVERLQDPVDPKFVEALETLADKPIGYIPPMLAPPD
jgi:hypothetical protein